MISRGTGSQYAARFWVFAGLTLLAFLRVFLAFDQDALLGGDSLWFLENSEYIFEHKAFPPVGVKPLGFSIYLSVLSWLGVSNLLAVQTTTQSLMDLFMVGSLVLFAYFSTASKSWYKSVFIALILLQPFTATLANVLLVEQLLSFTVFCACLLFGFGCLLIKTPTGKCLLVVHAFLLGFSILLRAEMIAVVGLTFPVTMYLVFRQIDEPNQMRTFVLLAVVTALPIFTYGVAQYSSTQQIRIANQSYSSWEGYYDWLRTWVFLDSSHHEKFAHGMHRDNWAGRNVENYPDLAFDDQYEKQEVADLTVLFLATGYTLDIDNRFRDLAIRKVRENRFRTYLILPLIRGSHYFLNLEGGQFYLRDEYLPKPLRYVIIILIFGIKLLFYASAIYGVFLLYIKPKTLERKVRAFATFASIFIAARWCILVALSPFIYAGNVEIRYVYILWPMIILLAIVPLWQRKNLLL